MKKNHKKGKGGRFIGKPKVLSVCDFCGKEILIYAHRMKFKHRFCDSKCFGKFTSIHGNLKKGHQLNIGRVPWNKGKSNEVEIKCDNCDSKALRKPTAINDTFNFCSNKCVAEFKKKHPERYYPKRKRVVCKTCSRAFTTHNISRQIFCSIKCKNTWFSNDQDYLEKLRKSKLRYIERICNNGQPVFPTIGKHESQILDYFEDSLGYEIVRQHPVAGYFIDGYCSALNLAIEIDEPYHKKCVEKDELREQNIFDKIGCSFLRVEVPK